MATITGAYAAGYIGLADSKPSGSISDECPQCGKTCSMNFSDVTFFGQVTNEPSDFVMTCAACKHSWSVQIVIRCGVEVFAARFYYVTFVHASGVHASVYVRVAAGEQILPRRTAAAISALFDGQVCHVLSAAEVTEQEMIADGVEDPIRVPGMPLVAPVRPGRPDEDGEE